jgi:hypothetical protein
MPCWEEGKCLGIAAGSGHNDKAQNGHERPGGLIVGGVNVWRDFWAPLFTYLLLLGVYLIILGIALVGLVSVIRKHEQQERQGER